MKDKKDGKGTKKKAMDPLQTYWLFKYQKMSIGQLGP